MADENGSVFREIDDSGKGLTFIIANTLNVRLILRVEKNTFMKQLHNRINNQLLKEKFLSDPEPRTTLSFYCYHNLEDPKAFRDMLYRQLEQHRVFGRIYVAAEGINAQISVPEANFDAFRDTLYSIPWLNGVRLNVAVDEKAKSFFKLVIKIRPKIVADGLNDATFDVTRRGKALKAAEFNALSAQPGTIIVDMRNHYESEVGYFEGAIRPEVETFREALPYVEELLKDDKDRNIIMYCTGGIRCEKASAYYLHRGFKNVHMVHGGIIDYAHQCVQEGLENKFIGKNFVFDDRLGERISTAVVAHCHQCGAPCDDHQNCANDACHLLFIQCPACAEKYHNCCSQACADFSALPKEERERLKPTMEFNGTRFGKGRYKAPVKGEGLRS